MNKLYLGISGKMGSGKTTLTEGIISSLEHLVIKRVSMAQPIKDAQDKVYEELNMVMEGEKDRDLLIALGLWGRKKSPSFWLDKAVEKMEEIEADIIICDDVRFQNEAEWFTENGLLIRLEGEQRGDNVDESRKDDPTETNLDNFNFKYYISNRHSPEESCTSALYVIAEHIKAFEQVLELGGTNGKDAEGER